MNREQLEEIKKLRETILEENDYRTRCVLAYVFVGLGYMDYLIEQAERIEELEIQISINTNNIKQLQKEKDDWKDTAKTYYMVNQELRG